MESAESTIADVFNKHYSEFCEDLEGACPEYETAIKAAAALDAPTRLHRFKEEVLKNASPLRKTENCPGTVLPGVTISESVWTALSEPSKAAVQQYLSVLSFCTLYDGAKDLLHGKEGAAKLDGFDFNSFASTFMGDMGSKMKDFNLGGLSEKIQKMIESQAENLKRLPERLLKGQLGKLIQEIIAEVKPEDFGLTEDMIKSCETNAMQAFELIGKLYSQNPQILQKCMMRIVKKLQQKFANGEFRIETMASEAEEFIKEFADNPAMVELMETFRNTFGMMDMETARAAGREGDARRNIVRERLRKKLEQRKGAGK
jgi:hypothetical protein